MQASYEVRVDLREEFPTHLSKIVHRNPKATKTRQCKSGGMLV